MHEEKNDQMTKGGLTNAWKHVTIALDTFYMQLYRPHTYKSQMMMANGANRKTNHREIGMCMELRACKQATFSLQRFYMHLYRPPTYKSQMVRSIALSMTSQGVYDK